MITSSNDIKHSALKAYWESGGKKAYKLPQDQLKRLKAIMVHLHTARSLNDIASGLGKLRGFHKLEGHDARYALSVTGNVRIVFDCHDSSTGIVTNIEYFDYH